MYVHKLYISRQNNSFIQDFYIESDNHLFYFIYFLDLEVSRKYFYAQFLQYNIFLFIQVNI